MEMGGETVAGEARGARRGAARWTPHGVGAAGRRSRWKCSNGSGARRDEPVGRRLARSGKWFERRASLDNAPRLSREVRTRCLPVMW